MTTNIAGQGPVERMVGRLEPERTNARTHGCAMTNPNNCAECGRSRNQQGGWCYMFRDEPHEVCMKHTALPAQIPNEFGRLLTTQALWGLYVEDGEQHR